MNQASESCCGSNEFSALDRTVSRSTRLLRPRSFVLANSSRLFEGAQCRHGPVVVFLVYQVGAHCSRRSMRKLALLCDLALLVVGATNAQTAYTMTTTSFLCDAASAQAEYPFYNFQCRGIHMSGPGTFTWFNSGGGSILPWPNSTSVMLCNLPHHGTGPGVLYGTAKRQSWHG